MLPSRNQTGNDNPMSIYNKPKLYKRTSTGATQVWWQEIDGDKYRTHSGQDGGTIVTSEWTTAKPKNEGKANATTGEQQAKLEVEANYVLKRKKGYGDTVEEAQASTKFSPMLAKEYEDQKKAVLKAFAANQTVLVQTKLDGCRCIANKDGLWSRGGNPILAVPHIQNMLEPYFKDHPNAILDGELYNHDLRDDFPKLISLVRKNKPTPEDFKESEVMEYWIYDYHDDEGENLDYQPRIHKFVFGCLSNNYGMDDRIRTVKTETVKTETDIDCWFAKYIEDGYEGLMIRLPGGYEQKRTSKLLKYKPEMDAEFPVVSIHEGEGNRSGMAGYAVIQLPNGKTSRSNIMGTRDQLRTLLAHKDEVVGKQATVLFFHYTPDGVPRFPRIKIIHEFDRW